MEKHLGKQTAICQCVCVHVFYIYIYIFFAQRKILPYFSPSWGEINLHATDVSSPVSQDTQSRPDGQSVLMEHAHKRLPPPVRLYSPGYSCMATINFHLQSLCSHILPGGKWQQVQKTPFINVSTTFVPAVDSTCNFNSQRANQQNACAY